MRANYEQDGTVWIPRRDATLEAEFDKRYLRLPNQLRWCTTDTTTIEQLRGIHEGKTCYIIGKGKSLDYLGKHEIYKPNQVFIALNEAIHKVESCIFDQNLYGTQLDSSLYETCKPKTATLLLGIASCFLYKGYVNKIIVDARLLGLTSAPPSACYAVKIAKLMGCNNLVLIGFEGCLQQDYEYASVIGYSSKKGGKPTRFSNHKRPILDCVGTTKACWVCYDSKGSSVIPIN